MTDPRYTPAWLRSKTTESPAGCWEWNEARNNGGYGVTSSCVGGSKRSLRAHRVAWSIVNGEIPAGYLICHRCDNPPCCNPDHLFAGTPSDNTRDAFAKGRKIPPVILRPECAARGSRVHTAKLTEAMVREILTLKSETCSALGRRFGVTHRTISLIRLGKAWAHITKASV